MTPFYTVKYKKIQKNNYLINNIYKYIIKYNFNIKMARKSRKFKRRGGYKKTKRGRRSLKRKTMRRKIKEKQEEERVEKK